jgi:hypothetical protein
MRQGTEMKHYTGILMIYTTISKGKRVYRTTIEENGQLRSPLHHRDRRKRVRTTQHLPLPPSRALSPLEMREAGPQAILSQLSEDVPAVKVDVATKVFCETSDRPVEVSGLQGPCSACTGEQEGWGLFGLQTAKQRPFRAQTSAPAEGTTAPASSSLKRSAPAPSVPSNISLHRSVLGQARMWLSTGIDISKNIKSRTAGVSSQLSLTLKKFTLDGKVTVVTSAGKRKLHFSLIVFEVSNLTLFR